MKNIFSITDKVIIITGGNGFLGLQFKKHLDENGAKTIVFDKSGKSPIDITNQKEVIKNVEYTIKKYGRIDGLVNVAAINAPSRSETAKEFWKPYEDFSLKLWKKEIEVNLTAAHIITQAISPYMMKQCNGSIIYVASDLAIIAPNNSIYDEGKFKDIAYVTSKAGILGLMRSWASYLGKYNIRVNATVPGGMFNNHPDEFVKKNSALNMLGRMAKKNEYNGIIHFLLSEASSYVTGASIVIDGGRTAL